MTRKNFQYEKDLVTCLSEYVSLPTGKNPSRKQLLWQKFDFGTFFKGFCAVSHADKVTLYLM